MVHNFVLKKGSEERIEQDKFVAWMDNHGIKFYAVPNGGFRNLKEAVNLKRSGVRAGVPDLCIPMPVKPYHGLYIEMKKKDGGKVSDYQRYWIEYLNNAGYCAKVAKGFEEAKDITEEYLSLKKEERCL